MLLEDYRTQELIYIISPPGVIGYFKFCKPNLTSPFASNHYSGPQYSPAGIGLGPYREHPQQHYGGHHYESYPVSYFAKTYYLSGTKPAQILVSWYRSLGK